MGIGNILKSVAPIAAGYFLPGSATLFGSQVGAQIAAGAATGAGIAALSGDDVLGGAVTGGLGGMTGGGLQSAAAGAKTTAEANLLNNSAMGQQAAAQAAYTGPQSMMTNSRILGGEGFQAANLAGPGPGGYVSNYTPTSTSMMDSLKSNTLPQTPAAQFGTDYGVSDVAREFGGGSEAMGYGKMGLAGLGVAGGAGAFDPEPIKLSDSRDKYDPYARLDLGIDTGIDKELKRDTGLRLLANGGKINAYSDSQLASLKEYGITPQYQQSMMGFGSPNFGIRQPVQGFVDVGGRFVASKDGDITDVDFEKEYKNIIFDDQNKSQTGQGSNEVPSGSPIGGPSPALMGAKAGLASAYADQQQQGSDYLRSQGLQGLANGGYLETGGEVGDGMSDEIEATIEGTQEARLSDGEFVVPADVVSHLGNGSSDAGAKRLYEMMDKIRMARTGTKKQGKEIIPERFMPA